MMLSEERIGLSTVSRLCRSGTQWEAPRCARGSERSEHSSIFREEILINGWERPERSEQ